MKWLLLLMLSFDAQPGPQDEFLANDCDICIYGGAAGGGKTFSLLLMPLQHYDVSGFESITLRRTFPQIYAAGGIYEESRKVYEPIGGVYNKKHHFWHLLDTQIRFGYVSDPSKPEAAIGKGAQIPLIQFDQLEEFDESTFWYLVSRNRSTCGVRPYIRATCNPEPGWLANLLSWWIDDKGFTIKSRLGKVRYVGRDESGNLDWRDTPKKNYLSFTFIEADLKDNPMGDPNYESKLMLLPYIERQRLLYKNWKVKPGGGAVFHRDWLKLIPSLPPGQHFRAWDFAATAKSESNPDPDYTATARCYFDGIKLHVDLERRRAGPAEVERWFMQTSLSEKIPVIWEQEPGSSGKTLSYQYAGKLAAQGVIGYYIPSQGDKLSRVRQTSYLAETGNLLIVDSRHGRDAIDELHAFPDKGWHDDLVDVIAIAFNNKDKVLRTIQPMVWR